MKTWKYPLLALLLAGVLIWGMSAPFEPVVPQEPAGEKGTASDRENHGEGAANRLIHEKSPYLLQHAYNPVDWYPWGQEAFDRAKAENKPIFLSVGYSTCHWCHVMERESFSDPEVATVMNRHFVSIKVDREERPDVDQVYMTYVQAATGSGGWPMSVLLTPDLEPFFGGTYFPRDDFLKLLELAASEWDRNRDQIEKSAGDTVQALERFRTSSGDGSLQLEAELLDRNYQYYLSAYDASLGGFGRAPKFPRPVNFNFLLAYHARTGEGKALEMTAESLRQMARGGMHDHLGGGFHRYSTDPRWFLPHFEKMLYDQAQLAVSYLQAHQLTGDPLFAEVARGILRYVLRDMRSAEGGFYSAEHADSPLPENPEEHAEGAFYAWSAGEIDEHLDARAAIFRYHYGVEPDGNVEQDPFDEFSGKNILFAAHSLAETAGKFERSEEAIGRMLEESRTLLLEIRQDRERPPLDDKILTAWNGLMISALARGYQVLGDPVYLEAAEKAAGFIQETLYDPASKTLKRRYRDGHVAIAGMVDDYAFLIQGLLDLYESSLNDRWLLLALDIAETQNRLFWDEKEGGFYTTSGNDPSILVRMKEDYDGAEPSPNSVAVLNLLRLSQMADHPGWQQMAERAIKAFEQRVAGSPGSMPQMMVALNFYLDKPKQILIAGERGTERTRAILQEVHKRFIPNKIVLLADDGEAHRRLAGSLRNLDSLSRIEGLSTAYICENYVCRLPTNQPSVVAELLDQ